MWRTAKFAITNLRVIREEGFVSKRQSATLLANVTDVKTRVPALGGPLGFGDLTIFTQSGNAGRRPVHDHHASDRVPRQDHGQEDGRRGATATPTAAAAPAPAAGRDAAPAAVVPRPSRSMPDAATLTRLAELRDSGAITAEEYEAKKAEILARM